MGTTRGAALGLGSVWSVPGRQAEGQRVQRGFQKKEGQQVWVLN